MLLSRNLVAAAYFNSDQCHELGAALRRCYLLGGTVTWSSLPYVGLEFSLQLSRGTARRLLLASILYLPLLFALRITFR